MGLIKGLANILINHAPQKHDGELVKEDFRVSGVSFYGENIKMLSCCNPDWKCTAAQIVAKGKAGQKIYRYNYVYKPVKLDPEPKNPQDKNAIRVIIAGEKVGYISRDDNIHVRKILRDRDVKYISAFIGGGQYKVISANKDIARLEENISITIRIAYS